MILIDNILVTDDIISSFSCDIKNCCGKCCVEGENGPPADNEEIKFISTWLQKKENISYLTEFLSNDVMEKISRGEFYYYIDPKGYLDIHPHEGRCLFSYFENNICRCSIEQIKPLSCALFPLRISKVNNTFLVNYEKRSECISLEDAEPLYVYLKKPLIKYFSEEFYNKLEFAIKEKNG